MGMDGKNFRRSKEQTNKEGYHELSNMHGQMKKHSVKLTTQLEDGYGMTRR